MTWTIYCHIHTETGRRYVGLTARTWQRRWAQHISQSSRLVERGWSHFANAIRKYGKDAFSHEVLEVCETLEAANAAEEKWIDELGTRDSGKGFNIKKGGFHVPHPFKNPWDRPEYREKNLPRSVARLQDPEIRARNKASLNTPESKSKRSLSSREVQARPDVKERIRLSHIGRKHGPETRLKISSIVSSRSPASQETRRKISLSSTGRTHTLESKKKMSDVAKAEGRKWPQKAMDRSTATQRAKSALIPFSYCRVHGPRLKSRGPNGKLKACGDCRRARQSR